jgi:hypothetical protein
MAFTDQQIAEFEKSRLERQKMNPNSIQPHTPRACWDRYCWLRKDLWEHYEQNIAASAQPTAEDS